MTEKPVPLTKEGMAKLQEELDFLVTVRRPQIARRIQEAKELTSAQNNAEFDDAKNEQAFVEGRILTLERIIQNAALIDEEEAHHSSRVRLGSNVTVVTQDGREKQYTIVGSAEASPAQGRISNESPVGKALLNKRVGDEVKATVPAGTIRLTIIAIN
ncbi:MAG: transcription elongation factor GreA [Dehalococcoidia bacterium SM23_28_2]|nr:MAG: transcription elongation factor GreA [Dehalococcoidia bacterium SM23_28_2]